MKILHVITSLGEGGAQSILLSLCKYDKENSHYIISLSNSNSIENKFKSLEIKYEVLALNSLPLFIKNIYKLYKNIILWNPDIVQTWLYHADLVGGLIAFFLKKKVIWSIHNSQMPSSCISLPLRVIIRINSFLSYYLPKNIICCAESSRIAHTKLKFSKRKLKVIFNGYPLDYFKPSQKVRSQIRDIYKINNDDILFGMIARYHPVKAHSIFIKAISELTSKNKNIKIFLIGEDINSQNLDLINLLNQFRLTSRVNLLGSRQNISDYLQALDFCVLPSLSEGFPNVIVESMACGIIPIASKVGDVESIIGDCGWLVEPGDINSLKIAIKECLLIDKEKKKKLSEDCIESILQRFSIQKMCFRYNELYKLVNVR